MSTTRLIRCGGALLALLARQAVRAETPDEWVILGARVHGGFGTYIAE